MKEREGEKMTRFMDVIKWVVNIRFYIEGKG